MKVMNKSTIGVLKESLPGKIRNIRTRHILLRMGDLSFIH